MWVMLYGAVAGSVDAGKSSLVGVLTHGIDGRPLLDNGCGSARMNVFQHKHEIETGRTSSLSQQMLGYDEEGEPISCLARPLCLCACVCVCVCVRTCAYMSDTVAVSDCLLTPKDRLFAQHCLFCTACFCWAVPAAFCCCCLEQQAQTCKVCMRYQQ